MCVVIWCVGVGPGHQRRPLPLLHGGLLQPPLLLNGGFQLHVRLLLDGLRRLQLLDQLHLQHLHLHYLLLRLRNRLQLLLNLLLDVHPSLLNFASFCLLDLLLGDLLLHHDGLLLVAVLLFDVRHVLLQALLVRLSLHFGLCRLLSLRLLNRLHDLFLFLVVLHAHAQVLLGQHLFLEFLFLGHFELLLHAFVVPLLEAHHVVGSLLGLLDLFPGAHFFLLEQRNAVSQHHGVLFHTK